MAGSRRRWAWLVAAAMLAGAGCAWVGAPAVSTTGQPADAPSGDLALSRDGRFAAFVSTAANLVDGDANGTADVFLHDFQAATTERISVATSGAEANGASISPSISGDGRYVAFASDATNLVNGDTNGARDVFLRDRASGSTVRISVSNAEAEANRRSENPSISSDGRRVAFESLASNLLDGNPTTAAGRRQVYVRRWGSGMTNLVTAAGCRADTGIVEANASSSSPAISGDGLTVAFHSEANNLSSADGNGYTVDVFVSPAIQSCTAWRTTLVNASSDGTSADAAGSSAAIDEAGRFVAFRGYVNLGRAGYAQGTLRRDLQSGAIERVGPSAPVQLSGDGQRAAFAEGTHAFVYDFTTGRRSQVNTDVALNPQPIGAPEVALSRDGGYAGWVRASDSRVQVRYATVPTVDGAAPSSIARGSTGVLTLNGHDFTAGAAVGVSGTGVTVTSVQLADASRLLVGYAVAPDAPLGPRDVAVASPGAPWRAENGSVGACVGCLVVVR